MDKKLLYNPFQFFAGFTSFLAGISGLLVTSLLAYKTGTHFNGLLNVEFARDSDFWVYLVENVSHWAILSLLFLLSGQILSISKIRIIDVAGTVLISRLPLLIIPVIRILPIFQSFVIYSYPMYFLYGVYFISVIWCIVLLFNAFKVSCNIKDRKLTLSFVVCILLSEILTRIFLHFFI